MREFVENIFLGSFVEAQEIFEKKIEELVLQKLEQVKIRVADEMSEEYELNEANIQRMGRTKMFRVRIRKGKVQRRIRKSAVPGFTYRGGKLVRMTNVERRHRKMAARLSKFKRRAKMQQSLRKRFRSLQRRRAMGVR